MSTALLVAPSRRARGDVESPLPHLHELVQEAGPALAGQQHQPAEQRQRQRGLPGQEDQYRPKQAHGAGGERREQARAPVPGLAPLNPPYGPAQAART